MTGNSNITATAIKPENNTAAAPVAMPPLEQVLVMSQGSAYSFKRRIIGRIAGLRTLETDSAKQRLLTEVVDEAKICQYTYKMIGLLEFYALLEIEPIKKSMAESIAHDLMTRKGQWY